MKPNTIIFETLAVGPLDVNCFILGSNTDRSAVVIDAGGDHKKIYDVLKKHNLKLRFIINTHAHFDHVGGVKPLQDLTGAQFLLHAGDIPLLDSLEEQSNFFGLPGIQAPRVDKSPVDNEEISFGDNTIKIIHTPGHSPGSVCLYLNNMVFSGDTLFAGSVGRTDLYGGSYTKLINSIKTRLLTLDKDVIVYPGHGEFTTIGEEKENNPFIM